MEIGNFVHDKLFAGQHPHPATGVGTLLLGEGTAGVVPRGAVLGKVTAGAVPTTGTAGANTGGGTLTGVTGGKKIKAGTYTVVCVDVIATSGLFKVLNPAGEEVGVARTGTAFVSPEINLTLNDVGTDFAAGDSFTIVVPAGSGKLRWVNEANLDGSAQPYAVLSEARTVAADADSQAAPLYLQGHFNETELSFKGAGDNITVHRDALKALNILTSKNLAA